MFLFKIENLKKSVTCDILNTTENTCLYRMYCRLEKKWKNEEGASQIVSIKLCIFITFEVQIFYKDFADIL